MPTKAQIEIPDGKSTPSSEEKHNRQGQELMDPTPMQPPMGYRKTPTLSEQIAQQVRQMKLELLQNDSIGETEEDADDFEIGDDFEPLSPHENDHIPSIKVLKQQALEINKRIEEANRRAAIAAHEKALGKTPKPEPKEPEKDEKR